MQEVLNYLKKAENYHKESNYVLAFQCYEVSREKLYKLKSFVDFILFCLLMYV